MALPKQLASVNFTHGLDTKTDDKLVLPGKLTTLQNSVFRGGTLGKMYGSVNVPWPVSGFAPNNLGGIATYQDELLLWADDPNASNAFSYSPTTGAAVSKPGGGFYASSSVVSVVANNRTQTDYDWASVAGITACAWVETAGSEIGLHVSVWDEITGAIFQVGGAPVATTANATGVHVIAMDATHIGVVWRDSAAGHIFGLAINTATPTALGAPAALTADVAFIPQMVDVAPATSGGILAYFSTTSAAVVIVRFSVAMAVLGTHAFAGAVANNNNGLGVVHNPGTGAIGTTFVIFGDGVNNVSRACTFNWDTAATGLANATLGAGTNATRIGGFLTGNLGEFILEDVNSNLISVTIAFGSIATAAAQFADGVSLSSKPLSTGAGIIFLALYRPALGTTTLEPTALIFEVTTLSVIGRVLPGLSAMFPSRAVGVAPFNLSTPIWLGGQTASLLAPRAGRTAYASINGAAGVVNQTAIGIARVNLFDAGRLRYRRPVTIGPNLFVPGIRPLTYDGAQLVENGFHFFPENGTSAAVGAGGSLSAGQYQVRAVYAWTDAAGTLHRSAPSPAVTVTCVLNDSITNTLPTLRVSAKGNATLGTFVVIEVYRTTANGTLFFRDTSAAAPVANDATVASVTFTSTQSDANLSVGELLYTTGNTLDAIAAPACSFAWIHKERIFLCGLEDSSEVRYSVMRTPGLFPYFNEVLSKRVPRGAGAVVAGGTLDDKCILFCENGLFAIYGDGPDPTGGGAGFSDPQRIACDTGCADALSVLELPEGLAFRGSLGMCLLRRDLSVSYADFGAAVETFTTNSSVTTAASVLVPTQSQARWHLTSNITLVFDYFYRQWSVFTSFTAGGGAVLWQGNYMRARSDGVLMQETPGAFATSNGESLLQTLETGWIKPGEIEGFARVWRALLLGSCDGSSFSFNWSIAYDYDESATAFSSDVVTVASSTLGLTAGNPMQVRRHLRIQKCEALRFLIAETEAAGAGLTLANFQLEIGVKKGSYKLAAAKSF